MGSHAPGILQPETDPGDHLTAGPLQGLGVGWLAQPVREALGQEALQLVQPGGGATGFQDGQAARFQGNEIQVQLVYQVQFFPEAGNQPTAPAFSQQTDGQIQPGHHGALSSGGHGPASHEAGTFQAFEFEVTVSRLDTQPWLHALRRGNRSPPAQRT